jgi:thiamine-phosphate pyrophosphorylase
MKPWEAIRGARLIPVTHPRPNLTSCVEAAVRGGVDVVQLREKRTQGREILSLAEELKAICVRAAALFTVNAVPAEDPEAAARELRSFLLG